MKRYPGRYVGMANPNPHFPLEAYNREIERTILMLGFKGIKMHPFAHAVNPLGPHARRVFDAARRYDVPVMVHTGVGIPWACPSLLEPLADGYPDVKLVVAHAGALFGADALLLAKRHANVYMELSWQSNFVIREMAQTLGASKLMMGSDHSDNAVLEIMKIRGLNLSTEDTERILGGTAFAVYNLNAIGS